MADVRPSGGLQTIFAFFLGLMVVAFIGVGVYTFHPPPHEALQRQIEDLHRRERTIRGARPPDALTTAERDQIQQLDRQREELGDAIELAREAWGRSTSIILVAFATLVMAVSLVRAVQLPVISNGLLLGGVFTMVYGVGWIVATDTSVARFLVMTVALLITLVLGYFRFVRRRAVATETTGPDAPALADLSRRVQELEERLNGAASALASRRRSE